MCMASPEIHAKWGSPECAWLAVAGLWNPFPMNDLQIANSRNSVLWQAFKAKLSSVGET